MPSPEVMRLKVMPSANAAELEPCEHEGRIRPHTVRRCKAPQNEGCRASQLHVSKTHGYARHACFAVAHLKLMWPLRSMAAQELL